MARLMKDFDSALRIIKRCPDCKSRPIVFLTEHYVGVCQKHWYRLADSNVEWGLPTKLEESGTWNELKDPRDFGRGKDAFTENDS